MESHMKKRPIKRIIKCTTDDLSGRIRESARSIRSMTKLHPKIALILGSGLGDLADVLTHQEVIDTSSITNYPRFTVEGHHGKLVFGKLQRVPILIIQGRTHLYETGNLETVLYPIHVLRALGIQTLIVTNAAGAVNETFHAGDLMVITDQINLTFENPLLAITPPVLNNDLYHMDLQRIALNEAAESNIILRQGVYCGVKGPSYETAAEIEMIRRIGGDAVGMSTVNEVSLAVALQMKVGGISCITNLATGIGTEKLSHTEVTEVANKVRVKFTELIERIVERIHLG